VEIFPRSSARFTVLSWSLPAMSSSSMLIMFARTAASRTAWSELKQMMNRSPASGSRTSLTCRFPATVL
jgi:hypothetical protein